MNQYLQSLISVLLFIVIGYVAKPLKVLEADTGKRIVKFLFTIPLPVLVFLSFASTSLDHTYLSLPVIAILLSSILMLVSFAVGKILKFEHKTLGTLIVAAGISSTLLFALPFITAFYGTANTKYLFLYDFGNGLLAWTLVYYLAGRFGNKKQYKLSASFINFLKTPMLWALILGISMSFAGLSLPVTLTHLAPAISGFTNPLLLVCVGLFLNFSFFQTRKNVVNLIVSAVIVMGISLLTAIGLTHVFGITGVVQKIVYLCAIAPAGSLTVAFSAEHELDLEFASALVAFTMAIAIAAVPLLILI